MDVPSSLRARWILATGLLLTASGVAAAPRWEPLQRLTDVRYEGTLDLADAVRGTGHAPIELPWNISLSGHPCRRILVGPGWIRFVPTPAPTASLAGSPAVMGGEGAVQDFGAGQTLDVLPAGLTELAPGSRILVTMAADGLAVRWVGVNVPGGVATAEMLLDRQGRVTLQHLRVPASISGLTVGMPGAPTTVHAASAKRLQLGERISLDAPSAPALPRRTDPAPASCVAETGTWCERADGPGTSQVWLSEGFDDLASASRGWTKTGLWHPVPDTTCPPGARWSPGGSEYFGIDGACQYAPDRFGSLVSPPIGPITAGTLMTFSSRLGYEGQPFDFAQIYVNGTLFRNMPDPGVLDPSLWYDFNPLDLSFWDGQVIQIEFYFEADRSDEDVGWFVDDVIVWDPNVGDPDCIKRAGVGPYAACSQRQATSWTFNEAQFCQGCVYTFYVLVECGREMHLPLDDMEGADITITNVEDPASTPPLRCVNSTARADAGLGPYRGTNLPSEGTGAPLDCCPGVPGPEVFYGPPFDVTDPGGRVGWGLANGCPSILTYDSTVPPNGLFTCADVSPSCGLLDRLSPGENQIMDCSLTDTSGLCGLYRVDIVSGGNVWTLFANCDGTNTPQFPIFFDCADAWAAYNPLPELTVANLVVTGGCPDLTVDFDIINIGCAEHAGDLVARIEASGADASCGLPSNILDTTVTGPFPPGVAVHVTRNIVAPCSPARVDVTADPLFAVAECTESPTAAACDRDGGLDTVTSFTCGCTAQLTARAGQDEVGCSGETIRLDASTSGVTDCATRAVYRWLDSTGATIRDWDPSPTHDVLVRCPAGATYTVEVACEGEPCTDTASVTISCLGLAPDAGADIKVCVGDPVVLDGSASVVTNCAIPLYRWSDPIGNEIRGWDPDPVLNIPALSCASAGDWLLEVGCQGEACSFYDFVTVSCVEVIADAGPDLTACEGIPVDITGARATSTGCTQVLYQWFDPGGNPVSGVLTDPDFSITLTGCPGLATLFLIAACGDAGFEDCGTFDALDIACGNPAAPVPVTTATCAGADVLCGAAEAGVTYWWDADTATDASGDGDPANDRDLATCDGVLPYPDSATRTARAWAQDAGDCLSFTDLDVAALPTPAAPIPTAEPACPGTESMLRCGSAEPGVSWDFDVAVDADADTVPDNDSQATTCDAAATYGAGSFTARVTVTAAGGCSSSATVAVTVVATTPPGEVLNDRATRSGAAFTMTWDATPGAATHRVSRGTIGTWYDHAADVGRGTCDTGGATTWTDPDDATDGGDWYYLITAVEPCGLEGTAGFGDNGDALFERPARTPTAACP